MSFIWGTSFILIKKSLLAYTPLQSGALRISFAFFYFLPIAIRKIKKLNNKNIKWLILAGFIGNFFPAFMFAYGETEVSSSIASMINSTTPIFVLITGLIMFKSKPSWLNVLGLIIGFIGTLGLVADSSETLFSGWKIGALVIVGATFFYGINTNILKYKLEGLDGLAISALSFLFIGPWAIAYFVMSDLKTAYLSEFFWTSTGALATLAFFSSFVAIILFVNLIKYSTAIFAASSTYIIPIFAIFWGLLDGESLSELQIVSIFVVFAGISLINRKNKNNQPSTVKLKT
ncbi:MAG: DMT family transporter [Bacteroidales bacterium]|nr:DMT family transporter [Bacteroidales bacterium]